MFPFSSFLEGEDYEEIALPANMSVYDFGVWPGTVTAGIDIKRDGTFSYFDSDGPYGGSIIHWMELSGRTATIGDQYEVFMSTPSPDAFSAGSSATNTWLQINTVRGWWLTSTLKFVNEEANATLQIRKISDPTKITNLANVQLGIDQEL